MFSVYQGSERYDFAYDSKYHWHMILWEQRNGDWNIQSHYSLVSENDPFKRNPTSVFKIAS